MKKRIIGILVCAALLTTFGVLISETTNSNESDSNISLYPCINSVADDGQSDWMQPSSNPGMPVLNLSINMSDQSQVGPTDGPIEIYEGRYWPIHVTAEWDPPHPNKKICLWVDSSTLPPGANLTPPCNCDKGSVTSLFEWEPTYCQAGEYLVVFYASGDCGDYYSENFKIYPVTIIVYNINRDPVIEVDPSGKINVRAGNAVHISVTGSDPDVTDCGWTDDPCRLSCSEPKHFFAEQLAGSYDWETTDDDEGEHTVTFTITDSHGGVDSESVIINVSKNHPPNTPQVPKGESHIGPDDSDYAKEYAYTASTGDPDGDDIWYWFEWGDGTNSGWKGPYKSGAACTVNHKWTKPTDDYKECEVKVKAKDVEDAESEFSEPLPVILDLDSDGDGWTDYYEDTKYYTDPKDDDTDDDGVKDSEDMDPLCDLKIVVRITRIKAIADLEKGEWFSKAGADFRGNVRIYFKIIPHIKNFENNKDDITPYWYVEEDIPDDVENIPIRIKIKDRDTISDERCDISGPGKNLDITFNVKNNEWTGEDHKGDSDGYGHASGADDGEYQDYDAEIWFSVYLTGTGKLCDGDTLTYWEEIEKYGTSPREVNKKYAIVIGMADYTPAMNTKGWPDLPDPDNDAQDMYDLLVDFCHYHPGDVWYFASGFDDGKLPEVSDLDKVGGSSNPTKANLEHALDDIATRATDKDIVVFYYAGHGGGTELENHPAEDGGRIDVDGDEENSVAGFPDKTDESLVLYDQEYFDDELHAKLGNIKHHRLIVILDCCHSGGFIDDLNDLGDIIITTAVNEFECAQGGYTIPGKSYTNGQFTGRFLQQIDYGRTSVEKAFGNIGAIPHQTPQIKDRADKDTFF